MAALLLSLVLCGFMARFMHCYDMHSGRVPQLSNDTDEAALLSFRSAITHDPLNALSSWNSAISFCNWTGVSCSRRRQRVVALDLSDKLLEGTLSPHVTNLSFLHSLVLKNNSFHGDLLSIQFERLGRLRVLRLSMNYFEETIPQVLRHCRRLEGLSLAFNRFTGNIPAWLGSLPDLFRLYLNDNDLIGSIPDTIGNLSKLGVLNIGHNNLQGSMPQELGDLAALKILVLGQNNLTGRVPFTIFNISSLEVVALAANGLAGHLPFDLGRMLPNLEGLYLGNNSFSGPIPTSLSNASMLKIISMEANNFDGPIPMEIGTLSLLERLYLWGNKLTNGGFGELSFLASLSKYSRGVSVINLAMNSLNGTLPLSIGNLSTSLTELDLLANKIEGHIPPAIGNLTNLLDLYMGDNRLTGVIPPSIGNLMKLQRMNLSYNMLAGPIPPQLYNLRNLGELCLYSNALTGSIPDYFLRNFTQITILDLSVNSLTSQIPSSLWGLKTLQTLDLSRNSFTGLLPPEVGNLVTVFSLDLSSNRLSGDLPNTLSNLQMLQSLNLSRNLLGGPIPPSFGRLLSLENVDLSRNSLVDRIPESLASLKHLKYLNLSYNRLEGEIPSTGIFANLSANSLAGNYGLCGAQQLGFPACPTNKTSPNERFSTSKIIACTVGGLFTLLFVCLFLFVTLSLYYRKEPAKRSVAEYRASAHPFLSYADLVKATNNFDESNLLGSGGFGSVFKGVLSDETLVAIKVLNSSIDEAARSFSAECEVMRKICHRNLVRIVTSCSNADFKALVLQYMSNGSLEKWLSGISLSLLQRLDILIDTSCALEYLHHGCSEPVVHCDLKPSNVLLDEDMTAHVSDFGIAKMLIGGKSSTLTETLGTTGYVAPELGLSGNVSIKVDVYSYGILVLEMFTSRKPTDAMFSGELSLRKWVNEAFPNAIQEVIDSSLLEKEGSTAANSISTVCQFILPIVEIGLLCSMESTEERIDIREALLRLNKIKKKLVQTSPVKQDHTH